MNQPEKKLTCTLSLSMKINLGNYESGDVFLSVSGIDQNTTAEEVEALLGGPGRIAYDTLKAHLAPRVRELREEARR